MRRNGKNLEWSLRGGKFPALSGAAELSELERAAGASTGTEATASATATKTSATSEASASKGSRGEATLIAGVATGEDGADDHTAED